MRYRIYEEFYSDVEKKLKRIHKKCKKYGNPFIFNVVGNEVEEVFNKETKTKAYYKFIIVEVEGQAKINDFECVAILENHEHGNIIRRINIDIDIPKKFKYTDNICEHCNSKRQRNELYIIYNAQTNEFKQVGSSCLMLYTNGLNAEYIASYMDGITELEEYDGFIGNGGKHYVSAEEVIRIATEAINKIGYFNSNTSYPTKRLVATITDKGRSLDRNVDEVNMMLNELGINKCFNIKDFYQDNTKETTKEIIDYYLNIEEENEFIHNVKVILKEGYVGLKNIGYLCYLPIGYAKHIKKVEEQNKQNKINETLQYFGEVGNRYKDVDILNMQYVTSYDTMYGCTNIYKIILDGNYILVWKSSKYFNEEEMQKVRKVTFTVKAHTEYKGAKQTEVTRCKLN